MMNFIVLIAVVLTLAFPRRKLSRFRLYSFLAISAEYRPSPSFCFYLFTFNLILNLTQKAKPITLQPICIIYTEAVSACQILSFILYERKASWINIYRPQLCRCCNRPLILGRRHSFCRLIDLNNVTRWDAVSPQMS